MKWDAFDDIRTPAAWLDQAKELTETPRRQRRTWSPRAKGALIAACLCVAVVGTVIASETLGVQIFGAFSTPGRSGYSVLADLQTYEMEQFSQALQEDLELNQPQITHDTLRSAADYVGLPVLSNHLLEQSEPGSAFTSPYIVQTDLSVEGDIITKGAPEKVAIRFERLIDHVFVSVDIIAFTEYADLSDGIPASIGPGTALVYDSMGKLIGTQTFQYEFSSENYPMANGDTATVVSILQENAPARYNAYFVHDGLLYEIYAGSVDTLEEPPADFLDIIKNVLDSFE